MKLLEVSNLTKRFGSLVAVNNVSFHIDKGELFGLIGPNGSGKSVLSHTISGVYRNNGGEVTFGGETITNLPPYVITDKGMRQDFSGEQGLPRFDCLGKCHGR